MSQSIENKEVKAIRKNSIKKEISKKSKLPNNNKIIGRETEKEILEEVIESNKAEFLAIYGRRRVGKTHLITNFIRSVKCVFFHVTGIQKGSLEGVPSKSHGKLLAT